LKARAEILNMDGSVRRTRTASVGSPEDSVKLPIRLQYPAGLNPVHFIRLKLLTGDEAVSENFYCRAVEEARYQALR
jgi:hypothetical protein